MDYNLKGRKVLITGAGDGIGRSLALAFGREGARVAGCARTQTRLEALSTEIEENRHLFHRADLTQLNDIQQLHDQVTEHFGGLDILINNAGSIIKPETFLKSPMRIGRIHSTST